MTSDENQNPDKSKLERMLEGIGQEISKIGGIVRGVRGKVDELIESTSAIYETIAYHQNHVTYPSDDYDFAGGADDD